MQIISETITTGPQQNVSGTSDNVGFFPYGWPAYGAIKPGWRCVQTGALVTVVGDGISDATITTVGTPFSSGSTYTFAGLTGMQFSGGITITPSFTRIGLIIPTNSDGGLVGWGSTAMSIPYSPTVISEYPIGSTISFQNGDVRTIVGWDSYGPLYIDLFWDSPTSSSPLFPITLFR